MDRVNESRSILSLWSHLAAGRFAVVSQRAMDIRCNSLPKLRKVYVTKAGDRSRTTDEARLRGTDVFERSRNAACLARVSPIDYDFCKCKLCIYSITPGWITVLLK